MNTKMRRADREVTEFDEIVDILRRAETVRMGLDGGEYPYVVPLSFGYEVVDGRIIIYTHGAKAGKMHTLLARQSDAVCIEADIFHGFIKTETGYSTAYESFIGFGRAKAAEGADVPHGLDLLMEHCGFMPCDYSEAELTHTRVYKIELVHVTGKRRRA